MKIAYLLSCLLVICFYLMGVAAADLQLFTGYTLVDGKLVTYALLNCNMCTFRLAWAVLVPYISVFLIALVFLPLSSKMFSHV